MSKLTREVIKKKLDTGLKILEMVIPYTEEWNNAENSVVSLLIDYRTKKELPKEEYNEYDKRYQNAGRRELERILT